MSFRNISSYLILLALLVNLNLSLKDLDGEDTSLYEGSPAISVQYTDSTVNLHYFSEPKYSFSLNATFLLKNNFTYISHETKPFHPRPLSHAPPFVC